MSQAPVPAPAPCILDLAVGAEPTDDELVKLILPAWTRSTGLPQHPREPSEADAAEALFWVEPCTGPPISSRTPPLVSHVKRLSLDGGLELVELQVGTDIGIVDYAAGLIAVLTRQRGRIEVQSVEPRLANLEVGFAPFERARFESAEAVLQRTTTGAENEDAFGGTFVTVYRALPGGLQELGRIWERAESQTAFWGGPYDWQMTSSGASPEPTGFVVRERWLFTSRKTHQRSERGVARHFSLVGNKLLATPPENLEAWPETTTRGWPTP